jgi:hypothetical protein
MDADAHQLVVQALTCSLSNCVEWINDKTANRVRSDPANQGLTPEEDWSANSCGLMGQGVLSKSAKNAKSGEIDGSIGIG